MLHAEDGGMVMYVKRLEAGRFKLPEYEPDSRSYPMEWRDLVVMVEGITEDPAARLRRLRAERSVARTISSAATTNRPRTCASSSRCLPHAGTTT